MDQLNLYYQIDENTLGKRLEQKSGKRINLFITDNTTSMLSYSRRGNAVFLRLSRIFLSADEEVLDEIAGFIGNRTKKTPLINGFVKQNLHRLRKGPTRKVRIRTQGRNHDLKHIYDSINKGYFCGRVSASITWGSRSPRAAAKRTLGSYCSDNNMIRINPVLDSRKVPRYFLEYVVYHEMLHADIGLNRCRGKGRRMVHCGEFRRRERLFRDYERAMAWEKKYL